MALSIADEADDALLFAGGQDLDEVDAHHGKNDAGHIRGHIAQILAIAQARVSAGLAAEQVRLAREIVKYRAEIPPLHGQAEGFAAQYDALNVHDDQFDACDASIGVAIAVAAVAALSENWLALFVAWVFGGFGVWMGMAGFLGLQMASPLATLLS